MSRQRPAPNPVTAPMAGELHRPSATTSISTRSGPPAPGSGSRFTKVSCSTSATASRTTDTRARFTGSPHPPAEADGLGDGLAVSPGVTVTVTVGTGCAFLGAGGAGGSTENRGLWVGGTTTMPTTPSEVKFTNGRTRACAVSEPARFSTLLIVPTGTPGTNGRSWTEADVTNCSPGRRPALASSPSSRIRPDPELVLPGPVTQPIWPLVASVTPTTDVASVASSTVHVCALTEVTVPTRPCPLITVSSGLMPSWLPASSVTVRA